MKQQTPRVLHVAHHPQRGGGYQDFMLRIKSRTERTSRKDNIVAFIDSPECSESAKEKLENDITEYTAFGSGPVSIRDYMHSVISLPACVVKLVERVNDQDIDIIHSNSFRASLVCAFVKPLTDCIFIMHIHQTHMSNEHQLIANFIHRMADEKIHVSEYTREILEKNHEKTSIVRSPINISEVKTQGVDTSTVKSELDIDEDVVVSLIGRMSKEKGHLKFVEAVAKSKDIVPNAKFLIVGTGSPSFKKEIKDRIDDLGIADRIIITGFWDDVSEIYQISDIVAVPSVDDNLPKVIQEALAHKCAVIASDSGGISELIEHNKTGLLIPEEDDGSELAKAIVELARNPDDQSELASLGYKKLISEFSVSKVNNKLEEIYSSKCYQSCRR